MTSVLSILATCLLSLLLASSIMTGAEASLIVDKEYVGPHVEGRPITVIYTVYNAGPHVVTNFAINDKSFSNKTGYQSTISSDGAAKFKIAKLAVNEQVIKSFVVKPVVSGDMRDVRAYYEYTAANGTRSGYSSSFGLVRCYSVYEYHARVADQKFTWSAFLAVASVLLVGVPFALYSSLISRLKFKISKIQKAQNNQHQTTGNMSERKVINKYFPPDFDPALIARGAETALDKPKAGLHKVRLMAPFSMQCTTCGDYIYKGKKFNARKEKVWGENYLGIQIFRFFIRCPKCSAEITFKTDPQNMNYVCEQGAQRNFEPWRDAEKVAQVIQAEQEEEEAYNPMKALENRTAESKREMDILDALDEIRTRNARNERVNADVVIDTIQSSIEQEALSRKQAEDDEDEAAARAAFRTESGEFVKRVADVEDSRLISLRPPVPAFQIPPKIASSSSYSSSRMDTIGNGVLETASASLANKRKAQESFGIVIAKKKNSTPPVESIPSVAMSKSSETASDFSTNNVNALSLLGNYSDDDED